MPRWLPLAAGIVVAAASVLGVIYWQVASGNVGKTRGLVVTNLRADTVTLTFDDGQSATLGPNGRVATFVVRKERFPQNARVTDVAGRLLFAQMIEYQQLSDAQFRVAIAEDAIATPKLPKPD